MTPALPTRGGATKELARAPRIADLTALFDAIRAMDCISVVGVSNLGKSALLRSLTDPAVQERFLGDEAAGTVFIYVDFNQMLDMTDQAFYELVLRCAVDALRDDGEHEAVTRQLQAAYTLLVAPTSPFEVPLRFAQAMGVIGDQLPRQVVFLFDELDGPVAGIDGRVFLNLRALKDRHPTGLSYITATNRRLAQIRQDPDVAEFAELFAHHTLHISMLQPAEAEAFVRAFAHNERVTFSEEDIAFIRAWAGGHPGLLEATARILGLLTGRPERTPGQDWIIHRRAAEILVQDLNVQGECRKIWADLSDGEQEALLSISQGDEPSREGDLDMIAAKHLAAHEGGDRQADGWRMFGRTFEEFVRRQHAARRPRQQGLRVDPDSGEVWVDGKTVPQLTNLEYRLLLLLYGRLGKICTKYEVVEAVWGEDYIETVDDARIEKLVSRLRQKLEPDAANPVYLMTVRGRGYKLADG